MKIIAAFRTVSYLVIFIYPSHFPNAWQCLISLLSPKVCFYRMSSNLTYSIFFKLCCYPFPGLIAQFFFSSE